MSSVIEKRAHNSSVVPANAGTTQILQAAYFVSSANAPFQSSGGGLAR
jgi:hypothetical protein